MLSDRKLLVVLCYIVCLCFEFCAAADESLLPPNMRLASNGTFQTIHASAKNTRISDNGDYWCSYEVAYVVDEIRDIRRFSLYHGDRILYSLQQAPGSDLYISNTGIVAFMDHSRHFAGELGVIFYSDCGSRLGKYDFTGASLFGFSPTGTRFAVGTAERLRLISPQGGHSVDLQPGIRFGISEDDGLVAVASQSSIRVYKDNVTIFKKRPRSAFIRGVAVSSESRILAVIYKRHLEVYSLAEEKLAFCDSLSHPRSFRDIRIKDGRIMTGIHQRERHLSTGILRVYDCTGAILHESDHAAKKLERISRSVPKPSPSKVIEPIPWPFAPFDSVCTVWNYYEQHMGYGDISYLHQGLDLITPIAEPTYSVTAGIVKCVLTLGGDVYWRVAISEEQTADRSNGWLYAHLIESSIQVEIGDSVRIHDYLGDIIAWYDDWGHIHFVEISDSGLVWDYFDDEWGINFNPLRALVPDVDSIPPVVEPVFEHSKFAFCVNERSDYLEPDRLFGDIDIIVKVVDYIGDSPWQLPAYSTYFWIRNIPSGDLVHPRSMGHVLNHAYEMYSYPNYVPYAGVIYQRDDILVPTNWMSMERNFYHNLTNSNGDSLIDLSERELALRTSDYPNGEYRVYVEVFDEFGNSCIDSMDVVFRNILVDASISPEVPVPLDLALLEFPNPVRSSATVSYWLGVDDFVTLRVHDMTGREIGMLFSGRQPAGTHSAPLSARYMSAGSYVLKLSNSSSSISQKLILLP